MKNISRLLIMLLSASFLLSSCEDEDVQRFPDFTIPVVLLATNVSGEFGWSDLNNANYSFTLDAENFDGAADGHKFFVGRSGTTSTLIDVTLFINFGTEQAVLETFQASELPTTVEVSPTRATSLLGLDISSLEKGDSFLITYEYTIDADNTGNTIVLGTPGADYCGGFTDQGEFCSLGISVTGDELEVEAFQANPDTVLRASATETITIGFSNPLSSLASAPVISAANGTLSELSRGTDSIAFRYTAAAGFTGMDVITIDTLTIIAATGNEEGLSATTFNVAVDDTNPTYLFGSFTVSGSTATLGADLSEVLSAGATISVTSDAFDDVVDGALGSDGTVSFPVGTLPDTFSLTFSITGMDVAGNPTDAAATVSVTIEN